MELPSDLLDLGDYGVLETIGHWRTQYPCTEFMLIHDASRMIQRNRAKWEAVLDSANPPRLVGQDRRTIEFPLPVRGLQLEDSRRFLQLQVADLVAGAACALMSARANRSDSAYAAALIDLGLLNAARGGIWPSAMIDPRDLETDGPQYDDSIAFIAEMMRRHGVPR
jgi:hypothetical protein